MKYKTTNKAIKSGYINIIRVGYCNLQAILKYHDPIAYNCGVYGWNYDVYHVNNNTCIVTSYNPFGNIKPDYETIQQYESRAEAINSNYNISYDERKAAIEEIYNEFIAAVINK